MSDTKTVQEWEKEKGFIVINGMDLNQQLTEEEFVAIPLSERTGVDHAQRTKFLTDNGYELTRGNMINSSLSARTLE